MYNLSRGAFNTQKENTGSGEAVGAITGWGMGRAKRGGKAALAVGGVCLGFVFFSPPRPSLIRKTLVCVCVCLNLIQNPSSGPTLASRDRCGKGCLNSQGSNIGVGAAA